MVTFNKWCVGRGGGWLGGWVVNQWGKASAQTFSNFFFKILTRGAVMTKAGSLFQRSPSAVARTLEYIVGISSKAVSIGREKSYYKWFQLLYVVDWLSRIFFTWRPPNCLERVLEAKAVIHLNMLGLLLPSKCTCTFNPTLSAHFANPFALSLSLA